MNEHTSNEIALEVLTPSALESLERASIDVQVSTAHRFPRSLEQFKKRAMNMVQQDLATAESCVYSRPVGKGPDGKQKYAEGASIRMAEIVAACYGNIRFGARIIEQTERYVKAEGVAHDLESNTAGKSEAMESTVKRDGSPYDERMRIVVAKACLSKALRDSIFRVVPRALCKSIYEAAAKVIAGQSKTLEQRRTAARQWLQSIKVDDARAFSVLDVKGWSEVTEDHLLLLTGLKTALGDNEITLHEAFPNITEAKTSDLAPKMPSAPAAAPVTATVPPVTTTATKPLQEPTDASDLPTCVYCHEKVNDMATHNCEGMQEALKKQPGATKPAAEALPTPTATVPVDPTAQTPNAPDNDALDSIRLLASQAKVSEQAIMLFCLKNKLAKKEQKELSELATSKLLNLIKAFDNILPEIQKIQTELDA